MIYKCKICGGNLNISEKETICTCEYCGTKQTVPRLDDQKKIDLYDRASYLRRNNEFDKASVVYEQIIAEDKRDAEAYWSLLLCKYGVEYVEDPSSLKRIPTINRSQFASIFNDPDYKEALHYASPDQKVLYEQEAKQIDEIQKGILDISSREEPYDIFICYKETDIHGRRTVDSVLAQDIYNALTKEGYKVFFSRISLEDKIGTAYEPYIFAALNSAKVMIAIGTSKENFESVWVKNEWSRYLSLIRNGENKTLVPAYRDMNPYDLPEEFAYLQAQDMSKLGFLQDLIHGLNKIVGGRREDRAIKPSANVSTFQSDIGEKRSVKESKGNRKVIFVLAAIILVAVAAGFFYFQNEKTKEQNYLTGVQLIEQKDYVGAADYFVKAKGYKDSDDYLQLIEGYNSVIELIDDSRYSEALELANGLDMPDQTKNELLALIKKNSFLHMASNSSIGSIIEFGSYEQDNDMSDGKEKIEWRVIDKEGDRIMLISEYALDCELYNASWTSVSWETCSLRLWLNNSFYNSAFSEEEKKIISLTSVTADTNPYFDVSSGHSTEDRVFLLSLLEADRYFNSGASRRCQATAYARSFNIHMDNNGYCWWWLRSPGHDSSYAASIDLNGAFCFPGNQVINTGMAIRPALWIDLSLYD